MWNVPGDGAPHSPWVEIVVPVGGEVGNEFTQVLVDGFGVLEVSELLSQDLRWHTALEGVDLSPLSAAGPTRPRDRHERRPKDQADEESAGERDRDDHRRQCHHQHTDRIMTPGPAKMMSLPLTGVGPRPSAGPIVAGEPAYP